jgi:hypothetical protein
MEKILSDEKLVPPELNQHFELPGTGNSKFSVDYRLSPSSSTELQYMSGYGRWKTYEQVNWNDVESILTTFGLKGSIGFSLNHSAGLFSNSVNFSADSAWQDYNYLNEEAEAYRTPQTPLGSKDENRIKEARKQQYGQTFYSTSYEYNGTLKPLYDNPVFGQSNLQYALRGTLVRSKKYSGGDGPELAPQWGSWVKDKTGEGIYGLNVHKFSANFAANVMDKQQELRFSADLPPLDGLISTNAIVRLWISETNASIQFKKPETIDSIPNNEWKIAPFYLYETLTFKNIGSLKYNMVTEPEENNEITSITSDLTLWNFTANFTALKFKKHKFIPYPNMGGEWVELNEEPSLNPRSLTLNYRQNSSNIEIIKNRIGLSLYVNSNLYFDFQRHTNSNFRFELGFNMVINNLLELEISARSKNAVIFRYFKGVPGMEDATLMYVDGIQNNLFVDLLDSFNFADDNKRRRSGFKMESFNLKATHLLGDWQAELLIEMSPYLNNTLNRHEVNTDISFLVKWSAISEIKTDIKYAKRLDKWSLNSGDK